MSAAGGLFTTAAMSAVFSPRAHVAQMLRFEAALTRSEARAGIVPEAAAVAIADACRVEDFDVEDLYARAATAGTLVIPLVRTLSERVPEPARRWVHLGATSQDAIDTALVLQMRDGLTLLRDDLRGLCAEAATLAERHRRTLMVGRTLLQQALPITFGLKAARWLALAARRLEALDALRADALALQFGGAAGTLATLGDRGLDVASHLADELGLPLPDLPWHAERDRTASVAAALGMTAGAMQKIAGDVVLLAQTEVGEVAESAAAGKGGSSSMPHKRNPVDATASIAAARLALGLASTVMSGMAQEHERGIGGWQAEWAAIPELFGYTAGAVARARRTLDGLEVNVERMRANLDASVATTMAQSLGSVSDPATYLGSADAFIDRALATYRRAASAP